METKLRKKNYISPYDLKRKKRQAKFERKQSRKLVQLRESFNPIKWRAYD